jgi:hypothetical protein
MVLDWMSKQYWIAITLEAHQKGSGKFCRSLFD